MTMTSSVTESPRASQLDHKLAARLAADEYQRVVDLLRTLTPEQWNAPTNCPPWDVRAMANHLLGMAKMAASLREQTRQQKAAGKRAAERNVVFLDALTGLQVDEHNNLTTEETITQFAAVGPKAAKARKRAPSFIRRRKFPQPQDVGGRKELWTFGFMLDTILTRDPWMHRIDIADAIGVPPTHTAEHDGVIVNDVVCEWAGRHGQPVTLRLSGPSGGSWTFGTGGEDISMDVLDFLRSISGRAPATGLLATEVPF